MLFAVLAYSLIETPKVHVFRATKQQNRLIHPIKDYFDNPAISGRFNGFSVST